MLCVWRWGPSKNWWSRLTDTMPSQLQAAGWSGWRNGNDLQGCNMRTSWDRTSWGSLQRMQEFSSKVYDCMARRYNTKMYSFCFVLLRKMKQHFMETLDVTSKAVIWDSLVLMPKPGNAVHCNSIVSAVYSLKSNWRIKTNDVTKTDLIWLLLFFALSHQ